MKTQTDSAVSAGLKILLVDDVPQGTIARKSILMGLGYTVETAESGSEALALMKLRSFDLLVTDYKMPGMDGLELIHQVKQSYPAMKIVLLSGLAGTWGFTEESTGADAVVCKSNNELSELSRTIKKLLTRKPARKTAASEKTIPLFMVKSS